MNVSELARRAGISASGVRWYERMGILPSARRQTNGYRDYSDADLGRVRLVLTLRRLGLGASDAGRLARECLEAGVVDGEVIPLLAEQRRVLARQRDDLDRLEIELLDLETTIVAAGRWGPNPSGARSQPDLPIRVLFVCNGNSARSQIGEALLGRLGGPDFEPRSAGTAPRTIHPLAVEALDEIAIAWHGARSKPVSEFLDVTFDYVITLSDSAREACPSLRGPHSSLHWRIDDPAAVTGTDHERLDAFRRTRSELAVRLRPFIEIALRAAGRRGWPSVGER